MAVVITIPASALGTPTLVGSGLDDLTLDAAAVYRGAKACTYRVYIDTVGATDTYKWSRDDGATWAAEEIPIAGAATTMELELGILIEFAAITGHTLNDYWTITATPVIALAELDTVKEALGISAGTYDALLTRLILAATNAIEDYTGHIFAKQTYTETVAGSAHPVLLLTHVPIVGTPQVISDNSPITDFEVRDRDVGSLYRKVGWAISGWIGWGAEPHRIQGTEDLNFSVVYEAGYVMPSEQNRDLPAAVEQACVETVVAWYKRKGRDPSVKSKKVGDLNLIYNDGALDALAIPASARALLSRRVR